MELNQSLHWSLLDHEIMPEKGSNRICTWIVWCQIIHLSWFTKTKSCTFYQTQIAEATTYSANTIKAALTLLLDKGMIRCIKPYQRKGSTAGIYGLTPASIRIAQKLYQKQSSILACVPRLESQPPSPLLTQHPRTRSKGTLVSVTLGRRIVLSMASIMHPPQHQPTLQQSAHASRS